MHGRRRGGARGGGDRPSCFLENGLNMFFSYCFALRFLVLPPKNVPRPASWYGME